MTEEDEMPDERSSGDEFRFPPMGRLTHGDKYEEPAREKPYGEQQAPKQGPTAREAASAGAKDAARSGWQAIEHVLDALAAATNAGLKREPLRGPLRESLRPGQKLNPAHSALVDDLMQIFAGLLDRAGEAARDVALVLARDPDAALEDDTALPQVVFSGKPGGDASDEFTVWNTGSTPQDLNITPTDLFGPGDPIASDRVTFSTAAKPPKIPARSGLPVTVTVAIPEDQKPGTYRGIAVADPGSEAVALTLKVTVPAAASGPEPDSSAEAATVA